MGGGSKMYWNPELILKTTLRAVDQWRNQVKRTRIARDMACSLCQKHHFTQGSKTCFAHISFKSTPYKNQIVCKPYVPGGTVTSFWVVLEHIEHAYLVYGPFLTIFGTFRGRFTGRLWHFLDHFGDQSRTKIWSFWGDFGPFLGRYGVIFGITLVSFWHHFGVVLVSFW